MIATLWLCLIAHAVLPQDPAPDLFAYGVPSLDYTLRGDFAICFDGRTRCPRWTLEHINAAKLTKRANRDGMDFFADPDVPIEFASVPAEYARTGYDLGHSAAAANHVSRKDLLKATFTVANAMPQKPELNRGKWNQLEAALRLTADKPYADVWIITAPIWVPGRTIESIGESKVWIPHFVGKAALISERGSVRLKAYVMPNEKCGDPLETYAVTVDAFERLVGIDVFAELPDDEEKTLEAMK